MTIAHEVGVTRKTAGKWRARYARLGERGLVDEPRSGRPSKADGVVRCQVIAAACSLAKQVEDSKPEAAKQSLDKLIDTLADKGVLNSQERTEATAASDTIYRATAQLRGPKPEEAPARTQWTLASLRRPSPTPTSSGSAPRPSVASSTSAT